MNRLRSLSILLFVMLSHPLMAQPTCDKIWDGDENDGLWASGTNWDPNGTPDGDDVACLVEGAEATIFYAADQYVKAIYIDSTSVLEIWGGDTLIITGGVASHVDGELEVYDNNAQLLIDQSITINGSGEIVNFGHSGALGGGPGVIGATSGSPVLTLASGLTLEGGGKMLVDVVCNGDIHATSYTFAFHEGLTLNGSMSIDAGKVVEVTENLSLASGKTITIANTGGNVGKLKARSGYSPTLTVSAGGTLQGTGEVHLPTTVNGTAHATGGELYFKNSLTLGGTLRTDGQGTVYLSQNLTVPSSAIVWLETSYSNIRLCLKTSDYADLPS